MFLMGKEYLSWAPRATVPKSCVVWFMNSLSAQAPWDCARAGAALTTNAATITANFLIALLPLRVCCQTPRRTVAGDSSVKDRNGEGGIAPGPPVPLFATHRPMSI